MRPWNWAAYRLAMLHVVGRMASAFLQQGSWILPPKVLKAAAVAKCLWLPAFVATQVELVDLPGRVRAVVAWTFPLRAGVVAGVALSAW